MAYATKIASDAFESMQFDSGMILKSFNPGNPTAPEDSDIVCATTGNITIDATYERVDLGEDVNCLHGEYKEFQRVTHWEVQTGFTALNVNAETVKLAFGAADISGYKVTPRLDFKDSDFTDIWWVGTKIGGGIAAVHLMNAVSNDGFHLTTTKDGKGNLAVTIKAFASTESQDVVPIEYFDIAATSSADISA